MKKFSTLSRWLLIALAVLLSLLVSPDNSSAQSKSFYWEQFDVDITVLDNGDLRIIETQTINFSGDTFSFGFRGVPVGNLGNNDGITDLSVSEGNSFYTESGSNTPRTFEVNLESGEEVIRWYFEPTMGRHTYTIGYTVLGGVRLGTMEAGSGDQVYWKPTPVDLPALIASSVVKIHLPEGIQPQKYTGTNDYLVAGYLDEQESEAIRIQVSDDGRHISYNNTLGVIPGQLFEVRVQFPHGLLNAVTPDWQEKEQRGDSISLFVLAAAILIAVAGPLLVLALWYSRGRDPELNVVVPEFISEPPDNLPPGLVGTLVDEKADMRDIISTLIDLASRGYLTISEEKRNHVFERTDKPDSDLRDYERQFLSFVFKGKKERSLDSLRYKFAEKLPKLRKMMYDELQNEALVPRSPETVRNSYGCLSFVVLAGAFAGFFALPIMFGGTVPMAICPAFSIGLTGLVLLVASRYMPVKSKKGVEASAKWEAFKMYLQNAEKYGNLAEATEIFEKYLAYATAFGLERSWIRKFQQFPATPIPTWYGPYYGGHIGGSTMHSGGSLSPTSPGGSAPSLEGLSGGLTGGLDSMSKGLTRMLNSTSTIFRSTPPSSSSGGSSGGFSGGFSGGSSGGGGSGGFG